MAPVEIPEKMPSAAVGPRVHPTASARADRETPGRDGADNSARGPTLIEAARRAVDECAAARLGRGHLDPGHAFAPAPARPVNDRAAQTLTALGHAGRIRARSYSIMCGARAARHEPCPCCGVKGAMVMDRDRAVCTSRCGAWPLEGVDTLLMTTEDEDAKPVSAEPKRSAVQNVSAPRDADPLNGSQTAAEQPGLRLSTRLTGG